MKLDEAIKHCENVAAKCFMERSARNHSGKCGFEHLELAAWLRELKAYKEQEPCEDAVSRDKAVVQLYHNKTGDDNVDVIIERDIATIHKLPPVTPKQKQEPILDKIRAEIEAEPYISKMEVLDIIDKYKAEKRG